MDSSLRPSDAPELRLSSPFTNHMVLQREMMVPVWGWGLPGGRITVSLGGAEESADVEENGRWKVELGPFPAGGPHTLKVGDGSNCITLEDVLVGEVWLCSGQSNMQMPVSDILEPEAEIAAADRHRGLRLFSVPKDGADSPLNMLDASWKVCGGSTVAEFSAVAWFFAQELRASPPLADIPIGLIDSSFGGTKIEAWMSRETLEAKFGDRDLQDSLFGWKPSSMYNAMIAPLVPFAMRGVLWYQGESNVNAPCLYGDLFRNLISEWRALWGREEMPFYFAQLPNYADRFDGAFFTRLREVQLETWKTTRHTGMAVTVDAGTPYDPHPPNKRPVGYRLGRIARALAYGEELVYSGPVFREMSIEGDRIRLRFDNVGGGLRSRANNGSPRGFVIAGADRRFWTAQAEIEGHSIVVWSDRVVEPFHVRYAWGGDPEVDLYNQEGLPASPFRTDDFEEPDMEVLEDLRRYRFAGPAYEAIVEGDGCLTCLLVHGHSFLDATADGSRGCYISGLLDFPLPLTDVSRPGPLSMAAQGNHAAIRYEFFEDTIVCWMKNSGKEECRFRLVFDPNTEAFAGNGESLQTPYVNEEYGQTTAFRGDVFLRISGNGKLRGTQSSTHQVWEATLQPGEQRRIGLAVGKVAGEKDEGSSSDR